MSTQKPIHPDRPNVFRHPLAAKFPMMNAKEAKALFDNIKREGYDQSQPVVMIFNAETGRDEVLDGSNRWLQSINAGVEPPTTNFDVERDGSPALFVLRRNVPRRNLDPSRLAVLSLDFYEIIEKERAAAKLKGEATAAFAGLVEGGAATTKGKKTREIVGDITGAAGRSISTVKRLKEKAPDLFAKVESSDLTMDAADKILKGRLQEKADKDRRDADVANRRMLLEGIIAQIGEEGNEALIRRIRARSVMDDTKELEKLTALPGRRRAAILPLLNAKISFDDAILLTEPTTDFQNETVPRLISRATALGNEDVPSLPSGKLYHKLTLGDGTVIVVCLSKSVHRIE